MNAVTKAHNMKTYTNQAEKLHCQANEIKHTVHCPLHTSCYKTMMDQQALISQARKIENAARDISMLFKEIAAFRLTISSLMLLRKVIISGKMEKLCFVLISFLKWLNN